MSDDGGSRHNDPPTSKRAAQSISATQLELIVWAGLFQSGDDLTSLEIARKLGMDKWKVSPRMRPLERKNGVIEVGKKYVINDSGNPTLQIAWRALP